MMIKIPFFPYTFLAIFLIVCSVSCTKESDFQVDVSGIDATIEVMHFDKAFYTANPKDLSKLKRQFPQFFPKQTPDSVWIERMTDKEEQELFIESQKALGNFADEKQQLEDLFKHVKYYFPNFKQPNVVRLMTLDYKTPVIYSDSLMFVSVDNYLGRDHELYNSFPKYISHNFDKSHLVVDAATVIVDKIVPFKVHRTFIDKIISEGKRMYILDLFLPTVRDAQKIGYNKQKMNWMITNEDSVWRYFIENKYLYSTDNNLDLRFIKNAPFSKFYLSHDADSPGKTGVYIGWQIVRAYMQKTNATLQKLLHADAKTIFKDSRYKPKR